jgi:hypothetical protein
MASFGMSACAIPAAIEPVRFATDDDALRREQFRSRVDEVADRLDEDQALHVVLIGHADEDNTDAYNLDLSLRRAKTVRLRMLERHPTLAERVHVDGLGELDPVIRSEPTAAEDSDSDVSKRLNRRVEFVFFYPRGCEPSFSSAFAECMLGRLEPEPEPEPKSESEPEPMLEPESDPAPSVSAPRVFAGPLGYASVGLGATSIDAVRLAAVWGVGGAWVFAPRGSFRLSVGGFVDHFIDIGEPFVGSERTCTACFRPVSTLRLAPELRVGAAGQRVWSAIRIYAGPLLLMRPEVIGPIPDQSGELVPSLPAERSIHANLGVGPSFSFRLWRHLTLTVDVDVSFDGRVSQGQGLYAGKLSLGWAGGAWVAGRDPEVTETSETTEP